MFGITSLLSFLFTFCKILKSFKFKKINILFSNSKSRYFKIEFSLFLKFISILFLIFIIFLSLFMVNYISSHFFSIESSLFS